MASDDDRPLTADDIEMEPPPWVPWNHVFRRKARREDEKAKGERDGD